MARSKSKHRRVQHKIRLHWKKRQERKKASTPIPAASETTAKKK
jgi:hypothetical protein